MNCAIVGTVGKLTLFVLGLCKPLLIRIPSFMQYAIGNSENKLIFAASNRKYETNLIPFCALGSVCQQFCC